jgi:hypothetical protein
MIHFRTHTSSVAPPLLGLIVVLERVSGWMRRQGGNSWRRVRSRMRRTGSGTRPGLRWPSSKRERWADMLARRPRRINQDSHKLHSDLDQRTCCRVDELPAAVRGSGLFYGFFDTPRVVSAASGAVAAAGGDAIFSLVPGELAVYFFHEGEIWLCQASRHPEPGGVVVRTS